MILDSICLKNIGTFLGEHRIELRPDSARKPVVLIGALNGSGKTTLIEALQLGLYGKRAVFGWRGKTSYSTFLEEVKNHHSKSTDEMMVEIELSLGTRRRFRVRRQWSYVKGDPRESLAVFVNGSSQPDVEMSELWDLEIEAVMPARLSQLFFFDGEKIEALADATKSAAVIKSAVSALLGLDAVDSLTADLEILRNRQKAAYLSDGDKVKIDSLGLRKAELMSGIAKLEQERASRMSALDHALLDEQTLKDLLSNQGGDLFEKREEVERELSATQLLIDELELQLRRQASGVLPLSLVQSQLEFLLTRLDRECSTSDHVATFKIINYLEQLEDWLEKYNRESSEINEVREHIVREKERFVVSANENWLNAYSSSHETLRRVVRSELGKSEHEVQEVIQRLEAVRSKRRIAEHNRSQLPEIEQISPILKRLGAVQERVSLFRGELESIAYAIEEKRKKLALIGRDTLQIFERTREADDAARIADYCMRSIETLKNYRIRLVEARRSELQKLILESFQALIRKPDLIEKIDIDPQTMEMSLLGPADIKLSPAKLSAGERQLLSISILWGLAKASGRIAPVVIDTPLGRLDGKHRDYLVERYFPRAGRQVILLSTYKEISRRYSDAMDEAVSKRYLIAYDPLTKSSGFAEGYFKRGAA